MVDTEMYDSECSACNTFYNVCKLTDAMLKDIRHLESEIVRLRYELSTHLPQVDKEMLRSDILSDLADRYYWSEIYQEYVRTYCNGLDPMDSDAYVDHMVKLAHGSDEVDI